MKARMMIVFLMVMSMTLWGQTTSDQQQVIELSLHMAEMDPNDHLHGGITPYVVIVDNGVLPQGLNLNYFGVPVQLLSSQSIASQNISSYVLFESVYVTADKADIGFSITLNGGVTEVHHLARLVKDNNGWSIANN